MNTRQTILKQAATISPFVSADLNCKASRQRVGKLLTQLCDEGLLSRKAIGNLYQYRITAKGRRYA